MVLLADCKRRWSGRLRRTTVLFASVVLILSITASGLLADEEWTSNWQSVQGVDQVTVLTVAPTNSQIVYAGTRAGLYRSDDAGKNWIFISAQPNLVALVVGPTSPDNLYAYFWPSAANVPQEPKGFRKSTDGGRTWSDPSNGKSAELIGRATTLAFGTSDPSTIFIGTSYQSRAGQIFRSVDGGATWQANYSITSIMGVGDVTAIAVHPVYPSVVYAGHSVYHGGVVIRSDDGGLNWQLAPVPMPLSFPSSLTVDPKNPNAVYVAYQAPTGAGVTVFRSYNGGVSWQKASEGLPEGPGSDAKLIIDPFDSRVLFLSMNGENGGVYRTTNRGGSWTKISPESTPQLRYISSLTYSPNKRTLYVGTNEGVWQSTIWSAIEGVFVSYYNAYDGLRVLGRPISPPIQRPSGPLQQYFEKGRLEDHRQESGDPNWRFMYGLLVDELHEAQVDLPVGGEASTISYKDINSLASKEQRVAPPEGFTGGISWQPDGLVFVPFNFKFEAEPGHKVPGIFWNYLNRRDLFPAGWLHDIGLPITEAVQATVDKGEMKGRQIWIQAFQRTILTYDPQNPEDYQIERANVGTDYITASPDRARP